MSNEQKAMTLADVKQGSHAVMALPADQAVDMFTERGFALANRIAIAYSSSDAVPAQFRGHNLKKSGSGQNYQEQWVENPSAVGNCLVAIEVARSCRMSITAVMQNADMIEGKLRWSGQFVIAAVNASGRFTPLRFQMVNHGKVKATYREKGAWNNAERRYQFTEKSVEVDNIECIAWALPRNVPEPALTPDMLQKFPGRMLDLYRALGLPVVESAPVTMRMAVEEGWFSKSGSKWQTEMRALMFQYRSGTYFGRIHAPDIVMGMGQTSDEARDMTFDVAADGTATPVPVNELRTPPAGRAAPMADVVERPGAAVDQDTGEIPPPAQAAAPAGDWQPSEAEKAAIRQRELEEAGGIGDNPPPQDAAPAPAQRARRAARPSME